MIDTQFLSIRLLLRLSIETFVLSCLVTCLESISHFTVAKEHVSRLSCNLIEAGLEYRPGQSWLERNRSPGFYSDIYGM